MTQGSITRRPHRAMFLFCSSRSGAFLSASLYHRAFALFRFVSFRFAFLSTQVEHAEICEEYEGQMKELESILASGPEMANVSVEQLVKQVCMRRVHPLPYRLYVCVFVCFGYVTHVSKAWDGQHVTGEDTTNERGVELSVTRTPAPW